MTITCPAITTFIIIIRLEDAGYGVGVRLLEMLIHREKGNKREGIMLSLINN